MIPQHQRFIELRSPGTHTPSLTRQTTTESFWYTILLRVDGSQRNRNCYEVADPSTVATSYGETYSKQYPRVVLTIDNLLGTVRWGVEVKWLTIYFTTPGLAFIVNTGTASGTSNSLSCLKPGSGTKNGWISSVDQAYFTSGQRSNQFDMSLATYAAGGITWTFSVRPF